MRQILFRTCLTIALALAFGAGIAGRAVADTGSAEVDLVPSPPGANDWACRPSAAHPRPVVLLHGTFENRLDNWAAMAPALAGAGYCVFALDYGKSAGGWISGVGPMADSAREIAEFVDRVLAATGARQVDIVGHSQGGMLPRYYLRALGGASKVRALIGLAPNNRGTTWGVIGLPVTAIPAATGVLCPACLEELPTSDFMRRLNSGDMVLPEVQYTVIRSDYDEFATPHTTSFLPPGPNVTNILLQEVCPRDLSEHMLISADPIAIRLTLNALDPEHAVAPACPSLQVGSAGG
ncbi:lipase family protein [Nocardia sp. CDC159]|uniref:Lipase family protein n=1 Tax=Nocardia pulmonis TaxID=2951408 RepID=A0A9X2IWF3_9NOCA|nr:MULTISPECIES: alpha/beta fold hydrolase [Nocardia]MCM6773499.1 lipase family protein [Nocardia pulmonis]MCM6786386.1 lipase family protein [Nocardia sp. CDC159]